MIEIVEYKPVNKGNFLGYFTIYTEKLGFDLYSCKLFQKNGKRWVYLPSREYYDENNEKKYAPVLKYRNPDHEKLLKDQCLQAINEYLHEQTDKPHTNEPF